MFSDIKAADIHRLLLKMQAQLVDASDIVSNCIDEQPAGAKYIEMVCIAPYLSNHG